MDGESMRGCVSSVVHRQTKHRHKLTGTETQRQTDTHTHTHTPTRANTNKHTHKQHTCSAHSSLLSLHLSPATSLHVKHTLTPLFNEWGLHAFVSRAREHASGEILGHVHSQEHTTRCLQGGM